MVSQWLDYPCTGAKVMLEPFLLPFCSVAAIADVSLCGRFFRSALVEELDRVSGLLLITGRGRW